MQVFHQVYTDMRPFRPTSGQTMQKSGFFQEEAVKLAAADRVLGSMP